VLATARAALQAGWQVSVLCPAGPFVDDHLRPLGVDAVPVDFLSASSTLRASQLLCQADLIHAHPGPSRVLALQAAGQSGAPVVFTIHGAWFDSVQQYAPRLAAIACVSPAVQQAVQRLCPDHAPRIVYVPNGVDADRFSAAPGVAAEPGHVVVASRLDIDKRMLVDTLVGLWEVQARLAARPALHYTMAGQGTLQGELEAAAQRLGIVADFAGWQAPDALASLYQRAAVTIASGRAAMEALAGGRPTLALASAGAAEVFTPQQLPGAAYSNFGGYGARPADSLDTLFANLHAAACAEDPVFAEQAAAFVRRHHDNRVVNQQLLALYETSLGRRGHTPLPHPDP
jgi:glycosyltransferase involved in cell wall biosynthesis